MHIMNVSPIIRSGPHATGGQPPQWRERACQCEGKTLPAVLKETKEAQPSSRYSPRPPTESESRGNTGNARDKQGALDQALITAATPDCVKAAPATCNHCSLHWTRYISSLTPLLTLNSSSPSCAHSAITPWLCGISPDFALEELTLKLQLQYFAHLTRRPPTKTSRVLLQRVSRP